METKHTKGEWKVEVLKFGFPSSTVLTYGVSVDEGDPICGLASKRSNPKEAEANAKLIAAAPELLDALKDVLTVFEERETAIPISTQMKIEQAIKKATS